MNWKTGTQLFQIADINPGGSSNPAASSRLSHREDADYIVLGLGEASSIDRLILRWGDGTVEEAGPVEGGETVLWRQGEGIVERQEHGDV